MASKSLGTLTLDLVAKTAGFVQGMDKSERASAKWRKKVKRDMDQVSKAAKIGFGIITGAVTAGITTMTNQGRSLIDSQAKLARSIDTSYNSISALSVAFADNGINNWEGSLARLNRRLGAAEKNMGPAVKAVEALNLDLTTLSQLDADERIAVISDAIKDAGISSQLAARYAQDLGFEQKEAAALFMAGGDAIRGYREEAERLGLTLSDIDAQKVEAANDAFGRMDFVVKGMQQRLAIGMVPALNKMAETINDPETIRNMQALADAAVRMADAAVSIGSGFVQFGRNLGQELGVLTQGIGGLSIDEQIGRLEAALTVPYERTRLMLSGGQLQFFSEGAIRDEIARLRELQRDAEKVKAGLAGPVEVPVKIDYPPEQQKKIDELEKSLASVEKEISAGTGDNLLPLISRAKELRAELEKVKAQKPETAIGNAASMVVTDYEKLTEAFDQFTRVQVNYKNTLQQIADAELSSLERKKLLAKADQDRVQALKDIRSEEINKLGARLQGGQATGNVRMDFINREGEFAPSRGKTSQRFEEAARRFADSIDSGILSPESAAQQLSMLDSLAGKYGALGEGFDAEGMKAAVRNLAAQTRDMFASGDGKPLTAEEMERVFKEAQDKAKAMEEEQRSSWRAITQIDQMLKEQFSEENKKPTAVYRFEVDQNGRKSFTDITGVGDQKAIADLFKLAAAGR